MTREGLTLFDFNMLTADLRPMGEGRPDGLHLSHIVRVMMKNAGLPVEGIEGEQDGYRAQLGFLFERVLEEVWKQYWGVQRTWVDHQISIQKDGIWMTLDGYDTKVKRLEEYKLTWKSARKWEEDFEQHFWHWLVQNKGYALGLSEKLGEPILETLFVIGFVNGDYKGPWRLGVWTDVVRYTQEELLDNWSTVLRYKQYMEGGEDGAKG